MKTQNNKNKKTLKKLTILQIMLLVIGIIAFAYFLGLEFRIVSAQSAGQCVYSNGGVWEFESGIQWECAGGSCDEEATIRTSELCNTDSSLCSQGLVRQGRIGNCNTFLSAGPAPGARPSSTPGPTGLGARAAAEALAERVSEVVDTSGGEEQQKQPEKEDEKEPFNILGLTPKFVGGIIANAAIAASLYHFGPRWLEGLGVKPGLAKAMGRGLGAAWATGKVAIPVWNAVVGKASALAIGGPLAFGIAAGVGLIVGIFSYKNTRIMYVDFQCTPWIPPKGGADCEKCNAGDFPCTEYQCKSLGSACELVNKGTEDELCIWANRNDITPPIIEPWEDALSPDYAYRPDGTISPPDKGVRIANQKSQDGCVDAFFPLKFGITTNEPSSCKIDSSRKNSFEDMPNYFGGSSTFKYNHSQQLSLPSPSALAAQNITLVNGNQMSLNVRCEDKNGNSNVANFVFNFCVDEGPDTTPPLIVATDILNNMPIAFNQSSVNLNVYVNEPAECKWSRLDRTYDDMETQMSCATGVSQFNAQNLYKCSTTLTGLKSKVNNDFYFRCKDQPELKGTDREKERNKNSQSYKFTLIGTQPLVIDEVGPNKTIRDSTDLIKVTLTAETSAGYKEGAATCYFKTSSGNYIEFYKTGTHEHSQDLYLPEGNYNYQIRCVDLGGNSDEDSANFRVESDSEAPVVVRAYHEGQNLKIITNEDASCVYSNAHCSYLFDDGISMNSVSGREHFVSWDASQNFYIKCQDEFGNEPLPNACSLIARPFEIKG